MTDNMIALMATKEARYAHQLDWALQMICRLAVSCDAGRRQADDSVQMLGLSAMVDSSYVNIRLMGDFLVRGTCAVPGKKDFGPGTLAWSGNP